MSQISQVPFGRTADGTPVVIYTLRNRRGSEARITNYGGILVSLKAPDKNGRFDDIVLGCDTLDGYLKNTAYLGALVGRYCNRIAAGKFTLDGKTYTLATNNGPNHLHGGLTGFDRVVWKAEVDGAKLKLSYLSKDGEESYPGNLSVTATYTLTDDNALQLEFTAVTDKPTLCNLTGHSYFNLRGSGDILGHAIEINAEKFTPVDDNLIPTGELRPVAGTPFDFRRPTAIGARINSADEQIKLGNGYDHNWVLDKPAGKLGLAACVHEPATGRVMELFITAPGMQFYTGNFLDGSITGKGGRPCQFREAFCLEPQHFPDSPNHPEFPSTVLRPGETCRHTIIYKFSAE